MLAVRGSPRTASFLVALWDAEVMQFIERPDELEIASDISRHFLMHGANRGRLGPADFELLSRTAGRGLVVRARALSR